MEGPSAKRAKIENESPVEASNEQNSSPVVDNNADVKRKVPKSQAKLEAKFEAKPTLEANPKQFADLHEHEILEIMQRSKLGDICALAEVCIRFKEIAQNFFSRKYRNVSLSLLADSPDGKFSLLKVRQLLYNFGHLISTLTIDLNQLNDPEDCPKLLTLVRKYCFSTIDKLEFENQPNERLDEYVVATMLGIGLMLRNFGPGNYSTVTKLTFENGVSTQMQTLKRID